MKEKFRYPYDRRTGLDRRSGVDRRKSKRGEDTQEQGVDRRSGREQRLWSERRKGWRKKEDWSSVWSELHEEKEDPKD